MTRQSPYGPLHALAAGAVLLWVVFSHGVGPFWQQFVYGLGPALTPQNLVMNLLGSTALFGTLILSLWGSTLLVHSPRSSRSPVVPYSPTAPQDSHPILFALRIAPALIALALGLNWLSSNVLEWLTHVQPAEQDLVKCIADGHFPLAVQALIYGAVLFSAPLLEEPLFRGIIFRGLLKKLPPWGAMLLSGALFALMHVNAATFIPLWFLGIGFAWIYHRTETILASMTVHFLFNAFNLVLLLAFPELAS